MTARAKVPKSAFAKTEKDAGEYAAWFTKLSDLAYETRSTKLYRQQYTTKCKICSKTANVLDKAVREHHKLVGGVRYAAPIYSEVTGSTAFVFIYWHFDRRKLLDGGGNVILDSDESHGRLYYKLSWMDGRWKIVDLELVV